MIQTVTVNACCSLVFIIVSPNQQMRTALRNRGAPCQLFDSQCNTLAHKQLPTTIFQLGFLLSNISLSHYPIPAPIKHCAAHVAPCVNDRGHTELHTGVSRFSQPVQLGRSKPQLTAVSFFRQARSSQTTLCVVQCSAR